MRRAIYYVDAAQLIDIANRRDPIPFIPQGTITRQRNPHRRHPQIEPKLR